MMSWRDGDGPWLPAPSHVARVHPPPWELRDPCLDFNLTRNKGGFSKVLV